jgi:hypothetical protein
MDGLRFRISMIRPVVLKITDLYLNFVLNSSFKKIPSQGNSKLATIHKINIFFGLLGLLTILLTRGASKLEKTVKFLD